LLVERRIFSKEGFREMVTVVDGEMKSKSNEIK
jgi:hypothetical protein